MINRRRGPKDVITLPQYTLDSVSWAESSCPEIHTWVVHYTDDIRIFIMRVVINATIVASMKPCSIPTLHSVLARDFLTTVIGVPT